MVLQNVGLQRSHVKPAPTPWILYSPITWASTTTHRTDPASSAPCSCPVPFPPSHREEPGGKWQCLTQLSKDQNTKIQQFLLGYCYLASVPQPKSMLSCRHPHAGTGGNRNVNRLPGKVGLFLLATPPTKSNYYWRPQQLQDEVSFEMCLFGFLLSF